MYHKAVQALAERVLQYIKRNRLLRAGDRVEAAVSGGADSVGLLRLLLDLRQELGVVLSVVHFNHQLRGPESDADEQFVADLAAAHGLEFFREKGDVAGHAADKHLGLEAAARELRYTYFRHLLQDGSLNRIATGHTLDDQAETVLLRVVRGAGTRGLAGIYPKLPFKQQTPRKDQPAIVRPLLGTRRSELEQYLAALGQPWREDNSNRDLRHARNRVRHGILPRLERNLNPAIRETLAETAEIARAEEEFWTAEMRRLLPEIWQPAERTLDINELPLALQRRAVRAAVESLGVQLEFRHVEDILDVSRGELKSTILPGNLSVSHQKGRLQFEHSASSAVTAEDYQYSLPVPGQVEVRETNSRIEAVLRAAGANDDNDHSFDPSLLPKTLVVRNWRAGDRYWPAHTKSLKKVKELLQEKHVTGLERKIWPVVASEAEVIWLRGFPSPAHLRPSAGSAAAMVIREFKSE